MTPSDRPADPGFSAGFSASRDRLPTVLLFTDIVGSTRQLARVGNAAWRTLIEQHDEALRRAVADAGGRVVRRTGDGALCVFSDPDLALGCALALHARLATLRLKLRAGLHLDDTPPLDGHETAWAAEQAVAEIVGRAGSGETLVSEALRAALAQGRYRFVAHGSLPPTEGMTRRTLYLAGADAAWRRERLLGLWLRRAALAAVLMFLAGAAVLLARRSDIAPPGDGASRPQAVAVLPFANQSSRPEDGYFAIGIQDEILTQLTKISALKVISRSSTRHYDSAPEDLREIGRRLGVTHVLEGRVQREGERARIDVQLIRVADEGQVWSEIYERPLADLLGVQSEVARAIAAAMNAKLSEGERKSLARRSTRSPEAYDAYLRGLAITTRSGWGEANMRQSIGHFEQATRLDPDFVQAWAQLASARSRLQVSWETTEALAKAAREATETALRLDPESIEARLAQAEYTFFVLIDFAEARRLYEAIDRQSPGRSEVLGALAGIAEDEGRWNDAVPLYERSLVLDPQNRELFWDYGFMLLMIGRFEDAHRLTDRAQRLFPDYAPLIALRAYLYMAEGRLAEAETVLATPGEDSPDRERLWAHYTLLGLQRRPAGQLELLQPLLAPGATEPGYDRMSVLSSVGSVQQELGQAQAARQNYEAALREGLPLVEAQPEGSHAELLAAWLYAELGDVEAARRHMANPESYFKRNGVVHGGLYEVRRAEVEVVLGDQTAAIGRLRGLLNGQPSSDFLAVTRATLRLDARWDPLRGNPEFEALLQP